MHRWEVILLGLIGIIDRDAQSTDVQIKAAYLICTKIKPRKKQIEWHNQNFLQGPRGVCFKVHNRPNAVKGNEDQRHPTEGHALKAVVLRGRSVYLQIKMWRSFLSQSSVQKPFQSESTLQKTSKLIKQTRDILSRKFETFCNSGIWCAAM